MLEVKKLSVSYDGVKVLNNLDLQVKDGEICTIVGPSGCGKSTLLKAIAGLINHHEGHILFNGNEVATTDNIIGYIPQNYGLLPWKTVEQNMILALKIKGLPLVDNKGVSVVDDALRRVDLLAYKKKYPKTLSGGQQQRIAIARAFILAPDILLMDEPFSALDAMTKERMQQFFLDIWKNSSGATLFITHDIEEAVLIGEKVVVMTPGMPIEMLHSPSTNREDLTFINLCAQIRKMMKAGMANEK